MNAQDMTLYSSATRGAEEEFGKLAEQHGIQEINYSFAGHPNTRSRGLHELTRDELIKGDVFYWGALMAGAVRESQRSVS